MIPAPDLPRETFREVLRYWEVRRIGYNIVLIAVVGAWLLFTWPHFRPALKMESALFLLLLAAMANACYCAAYPVDLIFQQSAWRAAWQRHRWILWGAGTLFAFCLANYWIADEVYPHVG